MTKQHIDAECPDCRGTGLYQGFCEARDEAVICACCGGTGKQVLSFKPFEGRKPAKSTIKKVRRGSGMMFDNPSKSSWISIDEFKALKLK